VGRTCKWPRSRRHLIQNLEPRDIILSAPSITSLFGRLNQSGWLVFSLVILRLHQRTKTDHMCTPAALTRPHPSLCHLQRRSRVRTTLMTRNHSHHDSNYRSSKRPSQSPPLFRRTWSRSRGCLLLPSSQEIACSQPSGLRTHRLKLSLTRDISRPL
jgi:hypothetical protein